uniref:Nitric oxide synthase n=1 Tax=Anopheles coluzzii TaxID=1518534 RepID=A0A6E8WD04_ANOCL
MMSQHLNSMLEHLKMGSLMSKNSSSGKQPQQQQQPSQQQQQPPQQVVPSSSANGTIPAGANGAPNGSCANNNVHCNHHSSPGATHHNNNNNTSSVNHNNNCQNGGPLVASGKVAAGVGGGGDTQTVLVTERREVAEGRESSKGNHVGEERRGYDMSRKRCSISVQQHGTDGTVVRTNYRELSPASLRIHRKSSHDIRNTLLGPDGEVLHLHDPSGKGGDGIAKMPAVVKPIKLKSLITKAESYDTMHGKATDIYCMSDYDISSIEHEALLLVVASTFGNGDPPENGELFKSGLETRKSKTLFAQDLYAMKLHESGHHQAHSELTIAASSKSFIKANSRSDLGKFGPMGGRKIDRLDSLRGSTTDTLSEETFGPLSNVRFAVFALGSSAYPNFCAFGKYIDNILGELGGERLMKMATGDEICGQEQAFRKWAPEVFKIACETFCLDPEETLSDAAFALQSELSENTVRYAPVSENEPLDRALSKFHNKKSMECSVKRNPINLHCEMNGTERSTILVEIMAEGIDYEPGDHVGIFPANRKEIVDGIIERLTGVNDPDEELQLQVLKEKQTQNGVYKSWEPHERLPVCSLRTLLTRFMDITTPPTRQLLTYLASCCSDKADEERLLMLANESSVYEDWRYWKLPHLLEVLEEFPSCRPPAAVFVAQLNALQPRFYSISSSPRKYSKEIHLTVAIVTYRAEDGEGAEHYGVCSNYLANLQPDDKIFLFVRSAPSFHMSKDPTRPVILIGPGTGIAPFRSFWQEWDHIKSEMVDCKIPKVWLFFGCRTKNVDLYRDEKEEMVQKGVLDRVFLALSREENIPKTYVQDLALKEADSISELILQEKAHIYVCGDVTMAEHVYQTLRKILATHENRTESEMEKYMLTLRDENRYHEDIFGITLRTAEIHNKSRATARIRMASQP